MSLHHGAIPFNCLSVLIFVGVPRSRYLQPLADMVKYKLVSWKAKAGFN